MDWGALLLNGATGGILGSLLHCVTSHFENKQKIEMMKAQVSAAESIEGWKAFTGSQNQEQGFQKLPAGLPSWVASFYVIIDGLRQLTRPALTWASAIIICIVYLNADQYARVAMSNEIIFGSFTAIFWWFGARYTKK